MKKHLTKKQQYESARLAAIRCFEVVLSNGRKERVFAHLHDGANNPGGHLTFIMIDREGHQKIARGFNRSEWRNFREIFSNDRVAA